MQGHCLQQVRRAAVAMLLSGVLNTPSVQAQSLEIQDQRQDSSQETTRKYPKAGLNATVGVDYLAEPIVNPLGGQEQTGAMLQGLWLQLKLGTGLKIPEGSWRELEHWNIATHLAIIRGDSDYYKQIGATYPLQTMTTSGQWLTELSLSREAGKGKVSLKAGVFTLNPEFMESDILNYYIHSAINDTLNDEVIGVPIAPLAAPGIMIGYGDINQPKANLFKIGLFKIVPSTQFGASSNESAPAPALNGSVVLVQWQKFLSQHAINKQSETKKVNGHADDLPPPSLMLGGYWSQTTSEAGARSQNRSNSIPQGQNRTIYGLLTLPLKQSADGISRGRLWIAGRVGLDWENNPAPYFGGVGVVAQGLIKSRPLDISGLALVSTGFSPTINPGLTQESVIELNHLIRISNKIGLKPFIQLILNPGGSGQLAPILAPGVQFSASL